jgi:hypothetical protein
MGKLKLGNKEYTVSEKEDKFIFKDISNNKIKVDFSFSKDQSKNKLAKDGWREFWTEVYR